MSRYNSAKGDLDTAEIFGMNFERKNKNVKLCNSQVQEWPYANVDTLS